jgi:hypothetical protein
MASGQVATTDNYVSQSVFANAVLTAIHQPNVLDELYKKYPGENLIRDLIFLGKTAPVDQTEWYANEEDFLMQNVGVFANVADAGVGNPITFRLEAADHLAGGSVSYPRVNLTGETKNKKPFFVSAVNKATAEQHTITLTPLVSTDTLGALVAGDKITFFGNAFAEGTKGMTPLTPDTIKHKFNTQIIKDNVEWTGSEETNRTWFPVQGRDGKKGQNWTYKGEADAFDRFMIEVQLTLLLQQTPDVAFNKQYTDIEGSPTRKINFTKGLYPTLRERGNGFASAYMTLAYMDTIIKTLDKQFAAKSNVMYLGIDLTTTIDNFITAQMKNDLINYGAVGGKERAAKFGFSAIEKSGYSFMYKTVQTFNHPKLMGSTGYSYANSGVILPMDDQAYTDEKGQKQKTPAICVRYKELDGKNRMFKQSTQTFEEGKTGSQDIVKIDYLTEQGLQVLGANRMAVIE